jgi:hypothetical protein
MPLHASAGAARPLRSPRGSCLSNHLFCFRLLFMWVVVGLRFRAWRWVFQLLTVFTMRTSLPSSEFRVFRQFLRWGPWGFLHLHCPHIRLPTSHLLPSPSDHGVSFTCTFCTFAFQLRFCLPERVVVVRVHHCSSDVSCLVPLFHPLSCL